MTAHLTGAMRDRNGARLCPLNCGPNAPIGPDGTRQHTCKMATSKSGKPGERVFILPMPGKCRMFYNERREPT